MSAPVAVPAVPAPFVPFFASPVRVVVDSGLSAWFFPVSGVFVREIGFRVVAEAAAPAFRALSGVAAAWVLVEPGVGPGVAVLPTSG